MLKKLSDFPDLEKAFSRNTQYNILSIKHFEEGLNPNLITSLYKYNYSLIKDKEYTGFKIKRSPILELLISSSSNDKDKQEKKRNIEYVTDTLINLHQANKIKPYYVNSIVSTIWEESHPASIKAIEKLLKNKVIDTNFTTNNGLSLFMISAHTKKIEKLIELGFNIEQKLNNKNCKYHNKTIYQIALEQKMKTVLSVLMPYLKPENLDNDLSKSLNKFKLLNNNNEQIKAFRESLKEKNYLIINEIANNQDKYKELIEWKDKKGKNLIIYTIEGGDVNNLKTLLSIDFYQNNKNTLYGDKCYATYACHAQKNGMAKELFYQGFKINDSLLKYITNIFNHKSPVMVNELINEGIDISLNTMINNFTMHGLDQKKITKRDLNNFFKENKKLLDFDDYINWNPDIRLSKDKNVVEIKKVTIDFLCAMWKIKEKLAPEEFNKEFQTSLQNLGLQDEFIGLKIGAYILNNFPEKESLILNSMGNKVRSDWLIKLQKENLENLLSIDIKETSVRKMKI